MYVFVKTDPFILKVGVDQHFGMAHFLFDITKRIKMNLYVSIDNVYPRTESSRLEIKGEY